MAAPQPLPAPLQTIATNHRKQQSNATRQRHAAELRRQGSYVHLEHCGTSTSIAINFQT